MKASASVLALLILGAGMTTGVSEDAPGEDAMQAGSGARDRGLEESLLKTDRFDRLPAPLEWPEFRHIMRLLGHGLWLADREGAVEEEDALDQLESLWAVLDGQERINPDSSSARSWSAISSVRLSGSTNRTERRERGGSGS